MASKLQEAAERHLIDSGLKHNNNFENHEVNEQVKIAFIVGSQYTEDIYKPKLEHSKEVIEELVKALEGANCYIPPSVKGLKTKVVELIQKHRNNEKQG